MSHIPCVVQRIASCSRNRYPPDGPCGTFIRSSVEFPSVNGDDLEDELAIATSLLSPSRSSSFGSSLAITIRLESGNAWSWSWILSCFLPYRKFGLSGGSSAELVMSEHCECYHQSHTTRVLFVCALGNSMGWVRGWLVEQDEALGSFGDDRRRGTPIFSPLKDIQTVCKCW